MTINCSLCGCDGDILCGSHACERPLCFECALMIEDVYYCPTCFAHRIVGVLVTCVKRITHAASVLPENQFRAIIEAANKQLVGPQTTGPFSPLAETIPGLSVQSLVDALSNASLAQRQPVAENEEGGGV